MKERPILFSAPMVRAILDTRAAPTMKPWVWASHDDYSHTADAFDAVVAYSGAGVWRAQVGGWFVSSNNGGLGLFPSSELAKSACVTYVEGKLKEWLV